MHSDNLVLVTGSAGRIGRAVVKELLARSVPVRGFDRVPTPGLEDQVIGDLVDAAAVQRAMAGVKTLIHLAATPDDDDFLKLLVPNNIVGVYHVFEAAKKAGVRRMILASSGQVIWHLRETGPWPIDASVQPTPRYWYAATKMFLEAAGRAFAEAHKISVIVVRLGWCPRTKEQEAEIAATEWAQDVYLSPGDAGRFFAAAATAPGPIPFAILYAISKPTKLMRYDIETARKLIGYEPRDVWPQGV